MGLAVPMEVLEHKDRRVTSDLPVPLDHLDLLGVRVQLGRQGPLDRRVTKETRVVLDLVVFRDWTELRERKVLRE